jgi:glycosyltransferase involved in cell wall biosynthesis
MADSRSSFDRKNPAGAVAAFRAAFGNDPAYKLILKLNGRTSVLDDLNIDTRRIIASQSNIEITTEFLDSEELDALYRSADVFLSLHRAEGFGLPILEAMARRIPVVVTAWSGNMDYTNDTNSVLIPCKIVPVQDSLWYSRYSNSEWAEPDIDAAALALRRLALERDYYEEIAEAGWNTVIRRNNDTVLPS